MYNKNFDRRKFLSRLGFTIGTGVAGSGFTIHFKDKSNDECKATPILELSPYTVIKYRKQANHDIDLTQIEGNAGIAFGQITTV